MVFRKRNCSTVFQKSHIVLQTRLHNDVWLLTSVFNIHIYAVSVRGSIAAMKRLE